MPGLAVKLFVTLIGDPALEPAVQRLSAIAPQMDLAAVRTCYLQLSVELTPMGIGELP
jgi:hypothetical protein